MNIEIMTENEFSARFVTARLAIIENEFKALNDVQRRAVMATEGPVLILAGAGSGKTTVLINRILNLIRFGRGSDSFEVPPGVGADELALLEGYAASFDEGVRERALGLCRLDPVRPYNIIAITFTNKAANELKERLVKALGPDAADVWASTFHSACMRILRSGIDRLGYSSNFTIYDTADSERVVKDILKDYNLDEKHFPPRAVLSDIGNAKDGMLSPQSFKAMYSSGADFRMEKISEIYAEYTKRLKDANALDFDDIILNTVLLLQNHADIREYYQNKFKYVMIDEYQDTNNLQYLFSKLLAGGRENICVVGDDDQSIYKFRGATIENILSFENQYKRARAIRLEQNYRSSKNILDAANHVIRNNSGRKGKELWTERQSGKLIAVYTGADENDEAAFIARKVLEGRSEGRKWSEFTVLYRINAQSNRIEDAFKRNGIPYRIVGGIRFFDRMEVKDMLAYLCVIINTADDLRLKRIINTPARGIGDKTVELVAEIAAREGQCCFEIVKNAGAYAELRKAAEKLRAFAMMIENLGTMLEFLPLTEFYEEVIEKTGYLKQFTGKTDIESRGRVENVNELKSSIKNYVENNDEPTLYGFLEEIALFTELDKLDPDADSTVMMTMHSAKGLEFDTVFVTGLEEGVFPGIRAIAEREELEEERRLCYVAMTRARHELYMTRAARRMLFGQTRSNPISRFMEEIPAEYIDEAESPRVSGAASTYNITPAAARKPVSTAAAQTKKPAAPAVSYNKGDMVQHKAFGRGMVISVLPMGGDAMLEIAFDGVGTKRLMAKSASAYLTFCENGENYGL